MMNHHRSTLTAALAVVGLLVACSPAGSESTESTAPAEAGASSPSASAEPEAVEPEHWEPHEELRDLWLDRDTGAAAAYDAVLDMGYSPDEHGVIDLPGAEVCQR